MEALVIVQLTEMEMAYKKSNRFSLVLGLNEPNIIVIVFQFSVLI